MRLKKIYLMWIAVCAISVSTFAQNAKVGDANKAIARKMYQAFETGNADALPQYVAGNYIEHSPDSAVKTKGLEGLKESVLLHHKTAANQKMNVLHMAADGDIVMVHVNIRDKDPVPEKDPKDRPGGISGVDVFRFENGKAVEHWGYFK